MHCSTSIVRVHYHVVSQLPLFRIICIYAPVLLLYHIRYYQHVLDNTFSRALLGCILWSLLAVYMHNIIMYNHAPKG